MIYYDVLYMKWLHLIICLLDDSSLCTIALSRWKENIECKRARKKRIRLYFCFSFSFSLSSLSHATNRVWKGQLVSFSTIIIVVFIGVTEPTEYIHIYIYPYPHSRWKTNRTHHNYTETIIHYIEQRQTDGYKS
jgi:hypothetical protein